MIGISIGYIRKELYLFFKHVNDNGLIPSPVLIKDYFNNKSNYLSLIAELYAHYYYDANHRTKIYIRFIEELIPISEKKIHEYNTRVLL